MINIYHKIYGLYCSYSLKLNGSDGSVNYYVCLWMTLDLLAQSVTCLILLEIITGKSFTSGFGEAQEVYFLFSAVLVFIINYLYFKNKNIKTLEGIALGGMYFSSSKFVLFYSLLTYLTFITALIIAFNMRW